MTSFKQFIYDSQPEYEYRVKMTFEPVPELMDRLEKHMLKYDIKQVSKPEKLMLQSHNVDFPNERGVEIYYVDITTGLPCSPRVIAMELAEAMGVTESSIKIRGASEAIEQDQRAAAEDKKEYKVKMGTDYSADEAPAKETIYGDEYNSNFLKELIKAQRAKYKYTFDGNVPDAKREPIESEKSPSPISGAEQEKYGMPKTGASK